MMHVRDAIEQWFVEVVQTSDAPITAAEIADAEALAGRTLSLEEK